MLNVIIPICLLILAGTAKAFQDIEVTRGRIRFSYLNKWKLDEKGYKIYTNKKLWYYLWIFSPGFVEKFPYSTTWLVFLTDKWHFYGFLRDTSLIILAIFYAKLCFEIGIFETLWCFLIMKGIMLSIFNLIYSQK